MKIYSKSNFIAGVLCLIAFVLNVLNILEIDWWYLLISFAFAAKFLYTGLTKAGSDRAKHMDAHYDKTARMLHGKNYELKSNLPLLLFGGFLVMGMVLKLLDIWVPGWILGAFVVALAVSTAYSIGLHREITEYIDEHFPQEDEPEP